MCILLISAKDGLVLGAVVHKNSSEGYYVHYLNTASLPNDMCSTTKCMFSANKLILLVNTYCTVANKCINIQT